MEEAHRLLTPLSRKTRFNTIEKSTHKQAENKVLFGSGDVRILASSSCMCGTMTRAGFPYTTLINFTLWRAGIEARGRGPK